MHGRGATGTFLFARRREADFHAAIEGGGDAAEHGKRVPFVVGAFELGDGALRRTHGLGQLLLGEASLLARFVDHLRELVIVHDR